jgi:pyruvate dehydrogenase E2 component (dihydrolipoamide acetyltransferase)
MPLEFTLPDVGEGVAEGEIVQWLVGPGEAVSEDQPVVEVETDKAVVEVPSPVDGRIRELRADVGDVVPVGDVLVVFDVAGEEGDGEGDASVAEDADAETTAAASTAAEAPSENGAGGRVFAAPSARRLARELGVDIEDVAGSGPSGRVAEHDVRAAADERPSDESAAAEPSSESAVEQDAAAPDGDAGGPGTAGTASGSVTASEPAATPPTAGGTADRDRTLAAPATRRLADELGVDLDGVPATGERDGESFVTPADVRQVADRDGADASTAAVAESAGGAAVDSIGSTPPDPSGSPPAGGEERIPYRGVRRTIGEQMEQSAFTAPHVTHHDRVDVTRLVEARNALTDRADDRGVSLSYLPFVVKAVTAALAAYPVLNSQLDEEAEEIVRKGYYNVGIATATDDGLLVPVLEDAGRKSLLEIAAETNELVAKARDRSISREEMRGGTFTITNFGAVGGEYATPIINYPETAILGLGEIAKRPWVVDGEGADASAGERGGPVRGEVVPRHVMTLSLSIDHRVIDGAEAAQFTNALKEYLRNPSLLLLE